MVKTKDTIQTSLIIEKDLLAEIKVKGLKEDKTQTEVILDYVRAGLERDKNQLN